VTRRIGRDLAATVGFNVRGFRDDDFKAARYTSPGAYVRVRLRFDQKTIGSILRIVRAE
jgi:hypothetical protein